MMKREKADMMKWADRKGERKKREARTAVGIESR